MTAIERVDAVIIGGGAAGFFTALTLAERRPQARLAILEAGGRPLQKVGLSGGGRCNLTHACFDAQDLITRYPRGSKALLSLFSRFSPAEAMAWFEARGLPLKTEADGRVFPQSDSAQDVIALFLAQARARGVSLRVNARIDSLNVEPDGGFLIALNDASTLRAQAIALATGYSPSGWRLAQGLGHRVIAPVPSLFPFRAQSPLIADLAGVTLQGVGGSLLIRDKRVAQAEGDLLITHHGVSGPLAYRLSAWGARALADAQYQATLRLDLAPSRSQDALTSELLALFRAEAGGRQAANAIWGTLPRRFWRALLSHVEIAAEARADQIPTAALRRLAERMKRLTLPIGGRSPSKEEFVSCGGVALSEVNFTRMESRLRPGLHFAGEILDIDGLTGGFNFQACWSAGWTAGQAMLS